MDLDILRAIEARDPDGHDHGEAGPSEADYAAHKQWAIAAFGEEAWRAYAPGGWEPGPDV